MNLLMRLIGRMGCEKTSTLTKPLVIVALHDGPAMEECEVLFVQNVEVLVRLGNRSAEFPVRESAGALYPKS
jgi:hypothetical protein